MKSTKATDTQQALKDIQFLQKQKPTPESEAEDAFWDAVAADVASSYDEQT